MSYLRRVLDKTRLIFSRINGPIVSLYQDVWYWQFIREASSPLEEGGGGGGGVYPSSSIKTFVCTVP